METKQSLFQIPLTISEVCNNIHKKIYLLPAIQREFVWSEEQIIKLFDSLMQDYPIGSFLFWKLEKERINDFQFYEFIANYHERDNRHNPQRNVTGEDKVTAILDGQQRLTALYIGLKGTYASKLPGKRWESDEAFPVRKLYVNLLGKSEENDLKFDFSFRTDLGSSQTDGKNFWFEVGKIVEFTSVYDIINFLRDSQLLESKFPQQVLSKLYEVINIARTINYYQETSQELDKVLNIFIRVNSGGTILSYSDLLLSIATARWKTKDARDEITRFVDEINQIGEGFSFDKDYVMKSCLVLSDIPDITFKGDNFNISNMSIIEDNWDEIKKSIRLSVELISNFGYNFQTLTSASAVIPISYYLMRIGNPLGFILSVHFKDDREKIRKWLTLSIIKRAFSGQPDNVLRPIRTIIRDNQNTFPLDQIVDKFKGTTKSITFTQEDIGSMLHSEYGKPHTFSVLALLYNTLDYRYRFHQDHIFPDSSFKKTELKKRGITEEKQKFYLDNNDLIGNLQLLEGLPNQEKLNKDFGLWLEETYHNIDQRKEFMKKHYIPQDIDLRFENFEEFFHKRSYLILEELRKVLSV